jgi:hypothetical protein
VRVRLRQSTARRNGLDPKGSCRATGRERRECESEDEDEEEAVHRATFRSDSRSIRRYDRRDASSSLTRANVLGPYVEPAASVILGRRRGQVSGSGQAIRSRCGRLSGVALAVSDDPHSTAAWAYGANGERALGKLLDPLRAAAHGKTDSSTTA